MLHKISVGFRSGNVWLHRYSLVMPTAAKASMVLFAAGDDLAWSLSYYRRLGSFYTMAGNGRLETSHIYSQAAKSDPSSHSTLFEPKLSLRHLLVNIAASLKCGGHLPSIENTINLDPSQHTRSIIHIFVSPVQSFLLVSNVGEFWNAALLMTMSLWWIFHATHQWLFNSCCF